MPPRRQRAIAVVAIVLWSTYWFAQLLGYVDLDRSDLPGWSREAFYGLTLGLPAFVLGVAVGRWWILGAPLLFIGFLLVPERCVEESAIVTACWGMDVETALLLAACTAPCVAAGFAARAAARRLAPWGLSPA